MPLHFPPSALHELFRLRISNEANGEIATSKDQGQTWTTIGKVTKACEKVEPKGYTASKWVAPVHVAATAVNAIHITTDYDPVNDRGMVFSLIPKEVNTGGNSYFSPSASIETNIRGGTGIFGGGWSPLVGNSVWVEKSCVPASESGNPKPGTRNPEPAVKGYVPAQGDTITIIVERYEKYPSQIVFENREGGLIYLQYPDGSRIAIGYVVRPVHGVGRFTGGTFSDVGRIRANHAGVIDIDCSPIGKIGGFQIIPVGHAHSPEMSKALTQTQWMIVAPLAPQESWEGIAPLFYQFIRPDFRPDDTFSDNWRERLLSRFLVEVRRDNGLWGACPTFTLDPDLNKPIADWANTALADVTALRILFPVEKSQ